MFSRDSGFRRVKSTTRRACRYIYCLVEGASGARGTDAATRRLGVSPEVTEAGMYVLSRFRLSSRQKYHTPGL